MAKFAKEFPKRLFCRVKHVTFIFVSTRQKETLLGFGIWNTTREAIERASERARERRGNDILDDQFCYSLEAASWTSFLSRSCEKALYNSESAKKVSGRCFGFFFVFLFL